MKERERRNCLLRNQQADTDVVESTGVERRAEAELQSIDCGYKVGNDSLEFGGASVVAQACRTSTRKLRHKQL